MLDGYEKPLEHQIKCINTRSSAKTLGRSTVATLFSRKSTRFNDKKTLDQKKNTRFQKPTYTVKMPRKCTAMPTTDTVQLIGNQRKNKREILATTL